MFALSRLLPFVFFVAVGCLLFSVVYCLLFAVCCCLIAVCCLFVVCSVLFLVAVVAAAAVLNGVGCCLPVCMHGCMHAYVCVRLRVSFVYLCVYLSAFVYLGLVILQMRSKAAEDMPSRSFNWCCSRGADAAKCTESRCCSAAQPQPGI